MNHLQTAATEELLDELASRCDQFCAAYTLKAGGDLRLRFAGNLWHLSGIAGSLSDVLRDRAAEAMADSVDDSQDDL